MQHHDPNHPPQTAANPRPRGGSQSIVMHAVRSRAQIGMDAPPVVAEAHFQTGTPSFALVGMAETAVRESRERVRSAIKNVGLAFPEGRVVVNLAPADLPKQGGRFDLAIAVAILSATDQIHDGHLNALEFLGELSLYGELRPVRGAFCAGVAIGDERALVIPASQARDFAHLDDLRVYPVRSLRDVVALLQSEKLPEPTRINIEPAPRPPAPSLNDVRGQAIAKRAIALAAAGGHHLLMVGPPGTGKTMLARRLAGLLPEATREESIDIANVYSASGQDAPTFGTRPFRDPHHSSSRAALIGGGRPVSPGEVSLAHRGVLFMDELPEFRRDVLESLREPLESDSVMIARANQHVRFPASFQLIAAMNPCPSGYVCDRTRCRCSPRQVRDYLGRISGPLLDRIDLSIAVDMVPDHELWGGASEQAIDEGQLRRDIERVRKRQFGRGRLNAMLTAADLEAICPLDDEGIALLKNAAHHFALSVRAIHRIRRVARTIADFENSDAVGAVHVAEALNYRLRDGLVNNAER